MKDSKNSNITNLKVTPTDGRYPTLVRGFNLRFVGTPDYVSP